MTQWQVNTFHITDPLWVDYIDERRTYKGIVVKSVDAFIFVNLTFCDGFHTLRG